MMPKPDKPCFEVGEYLKVVLINDRLAVEFTGTNFSGFDYLSNMRLFTTNLWAIKGISDTEEQYLAFKALHP